MSIVQLITRREDARVFDEMLKGAGMRANTFVTTTDMIQVGLYRIRAGAVGQVNLDGKISFRPRDLIEISTGQAPARGTFFTREELHHDALHVENVYCQEA